MITLSPEVLGLIDHGQASIRGMIRFDFSQTYGFWTGTSDLVYNGVTYVPGGIINVSALPAQMGFESQGLELSLACAPSNGLTPEILASIETEIYHQKPVTISDAFFHPDTHALLFVEPLYRGYVDTVEHEMGSNGHLTMRCESRAVDNGKTGYRVRSNADQQLIKPDDNFFQYVESAQKEEVYWGAVKTKS